MKKLLISILCFIPLAAIIAATVLFVDPSNLFRANRTLDVIYDITSSGQNADGVTDFADRSFVKRRILAMEQAPDTVILGSSHGAQIDSAMLDGTLFNSCVSGGVIEDVVSIYQIYKEQGLVPKRFVIAVDLWFFDKNRTAERCMMYLPDYYARFTGNEDYVFDSSKNDTEKINLAVYKELFSGSYFQSCAYSIFDGSYIFKRNGAIPTTETTTELGMMKSDGSYVYPSSYSDALPSEAFARTLAAYDGIIASISDSGGMDTTRRLLFEKMVESMLADGAEVFFIESPYHPYVYAALTRNSSTSASTVVAEITDYLETYAEEKGIEIIGSYDPFELGLSEASFMDALHITYAETDKLVSPVLN